MAGVVQEAASLDEQRAELEAVLASEEFRRAPALARLLAYLCEKLLTGESASIKEYSVGVEVFGRGPSFDQDSDSIVRVEANRLRKRLAAYYAGEGASHRLRISVPVGQYVPRIEEQPDPASSASPNPTPTDSADKLRTEPPPTANRRLVVFASLALLLVAAAVLVWLASWRVNHSPSPTRSGAAPAEATPSPASLPTGEETRILAGSSRSLVDHAGKLWSADTWFSGGEAVHSAAPIIWRTQEPGFYRNSRQGQFRYDIPLRKGIYELRLHFAETAYGPDSPAAGGEGSRLFTIRANQQTLLSHLDVVADAGASRTADVRVFSGVQPASDGKLHLEFDGEEGTPAMLSAIEILPSTLGRPRPVRILARPSPYYSNDSRWWSPDEFFQGGQLTTYIDPVTGTDDPELFESERWGNFSYNIPVPAGRYNATLLFAMHHSTPHGSASSPQRAGGVPSTHIFNVDCNGEMLLRDFDLAKETRTSDVVIRKFTGLLPNAQGKLLFHFVPVEGYAAVSGIEIVPQ